MTSVRTEVDSAPRRHSSPLLWGARLAAIVGASLTGACVKSPQLYATHPCERSDLSGCVIAEVEIVGNKEVPEGDIKGKIATTESSHAFGGAFEKVPVLSLWDRLTVDYETFDPFVLERDLARVERIYKARGYYDAHARAARVEKRPDGKVRVQIVVDEGPPVLVTRSTISWDVEPPKTERERAERRTERLLGVGRPLTESGLEEVKRTIKRGLTDRGYAYADVDAHAEVDLGKHAATVTYSIKLGPKSRFGPIRIEGLGDLPGDRLQAALGIKEGEAYSTAKIDTAERALTAIGVLGSVEATPLLGAAGEPQKESVPVVFHVTRVPLHAVKAGGGAEIGSRVEGHLVVGWENRNFLGGLRNFSVEIKPGATIFPLALPTLFGPPPGTEVSVLPEIRTHAELTQPGFLEPRTRGRVNVAANAYHLLGTTDTAKPYGYVELATKAGIEREFWQGRISLGLYGSLQKELPFMYRTYSPPEAESGFWPVTIAYAQTIAAFDMRVGENGKPDPINPHSGFYFSTDTQIAGADTQDLRIRPELRGYIPLARRVTLAMRVGFGFLFPYGGVLATTPDPNSSTEQGHFYQLLQFRGFTSGGMNSNRGYGYNGVGPQAVVSFVSNVLPNGSQLPIAVGGKGLWESSAEVRFRVVENLGMAVFLDASDVTPEIRQMNLSAPHLSTGIGLRYATPLGPIRADIGFRIPGLQVLGVNCPIFDPSTGGTAPTCRRGEEWPGGYLDKSYGQAGAVLGLPLSLSFAIGEAF